MPFVLVRVPLIDFEQTVVAGGVPIALRPFQPVVWVSLVPWEPDPTWRQVSFPAVLDTGNNGTVLIPERVFRAVTGRYSWMYSGYHSGLVNRLPLRCYGFNLELHRVRGDEPLERVAWRLQTERGAFVIPSDLEHQFPRVPVIGVRCLAANRLTFSLNGDRRTFSLWRPPARQVQPR
jgi:hypothetical protein